MIEMIFLCINIFAAVSEAACSTWQNVWEVYRYDTVDEAARVLGLPDYQVIEQMNAEINVQFVSPAQQITVPYISPISSPGTWTTIGCSHILHLRDAPSANPQMTDTSTQAFKSKSASLFSATSTISYSGIESKLPSSSYESQEYSTASAIESQHGGLSSTTRSTITRTQTVTKTQHSTTTQSTTKIESNSSETQPNSSKEESKVSQTEPTGSMTQTSPVSVISSLSAAAPLPSSSRTCHAAGSFYTRNETQKAYAQQFCNRHTGFSFDSHSFSYLDLIEGDTKGQFYMYSIEFLPNCQQQGIHSQNWSGYCADIMRENYLFCINGGMGGYSDSDCIRYDYRPLSPISPALYTS